jgi:hypothetical protein
VRELLGVEKKKKIIVQRRRTYSMPETPDLDTHQEMEVQTHDKSE